MISRSVLEKNICFICTKNFVINLAILSVYTGRSCEGDATRRPTPTYAKIDRTQLTPPIFSSLSIILSYILVITIFFSIIILHY